MIKVISGLKGRSEGKDIWVELWKVCDEDFLGQGDSVSKRVKILKIHDTWEC